MELITMVHINVVIITKYRTDYSGTYQCSDNYKYGTDYSGAYQPSDNYKYGTYYSGTYQYN